MFLPTTLHFLFHGTHLWIILWSFLSSLGSWYFLPLVCKLPEGRDDVSSMHHSISGPVCNACNLVGAQAMCVDYTDEHIQNFSCAAIFFSCWSKIFKYSNWTLITWIFFVQLIRPLLEICRDTSRDCVLELYPNVFIYIKTLQAEYGCLCFSIDIQTERLASILYVTKISTMTIPIHSIH